MSGRRPRPALWRCHRCGDVFTAWAAAERHADLERHPRLENILNPTRRKP